MKKYLMLALAVVTLASCSKSEDLSESGRSVVGDAYKAAFLNYIGGGPIASNQTWGFSSNAYSSAPSMVFTRAKAHGINFPDDADASKFLTDVPSGVKSYDEVGQYGYATGTSYIENRTTQVNIWGSYDGSKTSGGTLYIKGNCDFSNVDFYVAPNTEIYLIAGAKLTLKAGDKGAAGLQAGCNFYIAEGAEIIAKGQLQLNSCTFYNHGTVTAPNLLANGTGTLYNVGTVNVNGYLAVTNATSFIVNEGTITASSYGSEGSGSFWNVSGGNVTISGTTTVNSNSNGWINDGQYTTGTFLYNAGSVNVWNNCKLTCTELFDMTLGDSSTSSFQMDGGASIVANNFHIAGPARIIMGANSVISVSGTATMDCRKADYGIYGPTSGYAVFEAHEIVKGIDNQGYEVTYGNNLYIYSETTHFANGLSGTYPYIDFVGGCSESNIYASNFTSGKPNISISSSECNPGFSGGTPPTPPTPPTPSTADIRIIAEDLSVNDASDFDFNDIVLDVTFGSPAVLTLQAAGGTLPLRINGDNNLEVHSLFGVNVSDMVNTGAGPSKDPVVIDSSKGFNMNINNREDAKNLQIEVQKGGTWYALTAEKAEPASKLAVDPTYDWLGERQSIKSTYPLFVKWATDNSFASKWWGD